MKQFAMVVALVGWMVLCAVPPVSAKQGVYMGLGFAYNTIKGDFDGNSGFAGASDVIIVPEIDNGKGYAVLLGFGFSPEAAFELSYQATKHNSKWLGVGFDVDYSAVDLDFKYSLNATQDTQPYLLIGLNVDTLVVKDGSASISGQIGDATYTGTGFNLGVGVDQYLNPHASVGLGLAYRIVDYDHGEGVLGKGKLGDTLNGNGFGLLLDAAYHF